MTIQTGFQNAGRRGLAKLGNIVAETLFPACFLARLNWETYVSRAAGRLREWSQGELPLYLRSCWSRE